MTKQNKTNTAYLKLSTAAFQMAAVIGGFVWLGTFLDEYWHFYPLLTIVFALIGVALGLYLIIKEVIALNREN